MPKHKASCQGPTRVRGVSVPRLWATCYSYARIEPRCLAAGVPETQSCPCSAYKTSSDLWTSLYFDKLRAFGFVNFMSGLLPYLSSLVIDLHDLFCVFLDATCNHIILHHHLPDLPAVPSKMSQVETCWKLVVHRCSIFSQHLFTLWGATMLRHFHRRASGDLRIRRVGRSTICGLAGCLKGLPLPTGSINRLNWTVEDSLRTTRLVALFCISWFPDSKHCSMRGWCSSHDGICTIWRCLRTGPVPKFADLIRVLNDIFFIFYVTYGCADVVQGTPKAGAFPCGNAVGKGCALWVWSVTMRRAVWESQDRGEKQRSGNPGALAKLWQPQQWNWTDPFVVIIKDP